MFAGSKRGSQVVALIVLGAVLAGCAGHGAATKPPGSALRTGLQSYVRRVEPIRLAVNRLLNTADPILEAFRKHTLSHARAAGRMDALERQFAAYTVDVEAIEPTLPALRLLHEQYAHTYILEDAYLSALVSGLRQGELRDLPNTQAEQRAAIIGWRTGLSVLALKARVALPADLQQAGRGEVAPAPGGS